MGARQHPNLSFFGLCINFDKCYLHPECATTKLTYCAILRTLAKWREGHWAIVFLRSKFSLMSWCYSSLTVWSGMPISNVANWYSFGTCPLRRNSTWLCCCISYCQCQKLVRSFWSFPVSVRWNLMDGPRGWRLDWFRYDYKKATDRKRSSSCRQWA